MDLQDFSSPQDGAAYWDARLRSPECTAEDRAAFARWRDTSAANHEAFEELQVLIHFVRMARERPEMSAMRHAALNETQSHAAANARQSHAAANAQREEATSTPRDHMKPSQTRRGTLGWSVVLAASIIIAALLLDSFAASDRSTFETAVGEHREFDLADGSRVPLGARSKLFVRFNERTRRLSLEGGQAYFSVAKDEQRPFVVQAGEGTITATGTVFDVHQILAQVEVTVVEGSVEVASLRTDLEWSGPGDAHPQPPAFPTTSVRAGEALGYGTVFRPPTIADPKLATTWRYGPLSYSGQPLNEVIPDLQRYTRKRLVLADEAVGHLTVSGTVFPDSVQDWILQLPDTLPIEVEAPNRRTLVLSSRRSR